MLLNHENVTKLNKESVYDHIMMYLNKKGYSSENTKMSYERDIRDFFEFCRRKDIEHLSVEDVQIELDDFENFVAYKHSLNKLNNKTINRKVVAAKGLIKYLKAKGVIENDISYLNSGLIDRLPEFKNPHGVLTHEEVMKMAELALEERENKKQKYFLILLGYETMLRRNALLKLKWSDFEVKGEYVLIKAVDKGNKDCRRRIPFWFYEDLLQIKDESEKVFTMNSKSIDRMMARLRDKMNISEERNIVFHSIRKAGITFQYQLTKDIKVAQKAANHSSSVTTDLYIDDEKIDIVGALAITKELDNELYKKVDHEILLSALNECSDDMKLKINLKIHELLKKNK